MARARQWFGSLSRRLLLAFLTVAIGAVAVLALIATFSVDRTTAQFLADQQAQVRTQIAGALSAAYASGRGSWAASDLTAAQALATADGVQVVVTDDTGHEVADLHPGHESSETSGHDGSPQNGSPQNGSTPPAPGPTASSSARPEHGGSAHTGSGAHAGDAVTGDSTVPLEPALLSAATSPTGGPPQARSDAVEVPIMADGVQVGTAWMTLPDDSASGVSAVRASLLRSVGLGAAVAIALAAASAAVVSRLVSRPLLALADAARALAAGEPDPERRVRPAPGELGEVGRAFTVMAATVRRQEELRRAVVADVAHELRTPVTILRGQTEQLLDGVAEPTPERLVSLHDEVLRLQRLTDDLATLSAADAAAVSLHLVATDLGELVRDTVKAMAVQFDDADLRVDLDAAVGVVVLADATRLTQVVTNLLSNAIKFTPPGGQVTVTVQDGTRAELVVRDTGPGIPDEDLPHIFERFWRGRDARSRGGSGIGLAVVDALVSAHLGEVSAVRANDGGTRMIVRLPRVAAPVRT